MLNKKQIIKKILPLSRVTILKSDYTNKFYVSLYGIEIKENDMLHTPCFNCDTPLEALQTTFTALIFAKLIVKDAYGANRKEFRWIKNRFQKV